MSTCAEAGCSEYNGLSRRGLLGTAGAIFAGAGLTAFAGAVPASAAGGSVLVVVSLRGGIDGLSFLVPHGDPAYYKARPTIAVPKDELWAGDGMFGLSSGLKPLKILWDERKVAFVTAAGLSEANRSHFHAITELEASGTEPSRSGWIGRMTGTPEIASSLAGVSLTGGQPVAFNGSANVANAGSINSLRIAGTEPNSSAALSAARKELFSKMWAAAPSNHPMRAAGREALQITNAMTSAPILSPQNGAKYTGGQGHNFQQIASLIKSPLPISVIHTENIGWDTHTGMGGKASALNGSFHSIADNIAALFQDLGPLGDKVTLVTISEFGRRTVENGSQGLEHGWGNMVMVVGAGVNGGKIHGTWPGLGTDLTVDSDLRVTTDYRNILREILSKRFPTVSTSGVFPGLVAKKVGVML